MKSNLRLLSREIEAGDLAGARETPNDGGEALELALVLFEHSNARLLDRGLREGLAELERLLEQVRLGLRVRGGSARTRGVPEERSAASEPERHTDPDRRLVRALAREDAVVLERQLGVRQDARSGDRRVAP